MPATPRTFTWREFDMGALLAAKGDQRISVCLPARDEAATVGQVVETVVTQLTGPGALVDEVIVVDDGSVDETAKLAAEAGATVVSVDDVLPQCGPGAGKGEALWKSLATCSGDLVVWCDTDVTNFEAHFVLGLLGPLLTDPSVEFVKAYYFRPLDGRAGEGGRVTELVARPLMSLCFPHLATIVQPLAGEYAGRRSMLERVPFMQGYGVDLALLVDVAALVGLDAIAQVDLGTRIHRNRPLSELSLQAMAVLQTGLRRAGVRWDPEWASTLVRPGFAPADVDLSERPPLVDVPSYRRGRPSPPRPTG